MEILSVINKKKKTSYTDQKEIEDIRTNIRPKREEIFVKRKKRKKKLFLAEVFNPLNVGFILLDVFIYKGECLSRLINLTAFISWLKGQSNIRRTLSVIIQNLAKLTE